MHAENYTLATRNRELASEVAQLKTEVAKLQGKVARLKAGDDVSTAASESDDAIVRKLKAKVNKLEAERWSGHLRSAATYPLSREQFQQLRAAVHPDTYHQEERRKAAFRLFNELESKLVASEPPPAPEGLRPSNPVPRTAAEWEAGRRKADADRAEQSTEGLHLENV